MQKYVYVFDLDHTLAHFVSGVEPIFSIAAEYGVPLEESKKLLMTLSRDAAGFSLARFVQSVPVLSTDTLFIDRLYDFFHTDYQVYLEVLECISSLRVAGAPVWIATAWDNSFQREKIALLHLSVDTVRVVAPTAWKVSVLREAYEAFPEHAIVFVDDKFSELSRVYDAFPEDPRMILRCIRREDATPIPVDARRVCPIIETLSDIPL